MNSPAFECRLRTELNKLLAGRGLEVSIRDVPPDDAGLVLDIEIRLSGDAAERLAAVAELYKRSPIDLVADILHIIIREDLWNALIDS